MWASRETSIKMTEGDWGIELPITISGVTLGASDSIKITVKKSERTVLFKEFTNIQNNTVKLVLTEQESASLPVGMYLYSLDWYQDGIFVCNIVPSGSFEVGDKV